ncbi:DNA polymerase III subunit tau [Gammaproteobacteria bacterium]
MAYQVLARKWRPHTFAEMVGQEHVLRAIIHALDSGRLHHAFLFTGTRGVGKTTIARILAKSLNCERGVSSQPCGVCSACRGIDEGRFVDLIEVDAASRTKVEDTRELLENVQYAPTYGRYKVYLIDEVHMFSNHSFNALLKTLEEPPPHVKFLLATTDPQRLPVTILSRCLQFSLRRLSLPLIRDQLARILETEGMSFEESALRELARAADGSMRDGLSLLDQAIAYGGGRVVTQDVYAMLGTLSRDRAYALLEDLAAGNAWALLATVESLAQQSPDWSALLGELVILLQRVALAQFVPEAVDDHLGDRDRILALARQMSLEDVQLHYQIGLMGRRDIPLAPQPRGGFEMVLLRMLVFRPVPEEASLPSSGNAAPVPALSRGAVSPEPPRAPRSASAPFPAPAPSAAKVEIPPPDLVRPVVAAPPVVMPAVAVSAEPLSDLNWPGLVATLGLTGTNHQLAMNCSLVQVEGTTLHLSLNVNEGQSFLLNKERERRVEQAVQVRLGEEMRVSITTPTTTSSPSAPTPAQLHDRRQHERETAARASIENDLQVQAFRKTFNADLDPKSIRPLDG